MDAELQVPTRHRRNVASCSGPDDAGLSRESAGQCQRVWANTETRTRELTREECRDLVGLCSARRGEERPPEEQLASSAVVRQRAV